VLDNDEELQNDASLDDVLAEGGGKDENKNAGSYKDLNSMELLDDSQATENMFDVSQ